MSFEFAERAPHPDPLPVKNGERVRKVEAVVAVTAR